MPLMSVKNARKFMSVEVAAASNKANEPYP